MFLYALAILLAGVVIFVVRFCLVLPQRRIRAPRQNVRSSLAVFLGSGGHTSEALKLLSSLDFQRYTPRTYILSEGDMLSLQKAVELEKYKASTQPYSSTSDFSVLNIPRARKVHQPLYTTPGTALVSLLVSIYHISIDPILHPKSSIRKFSDILILNGPGTCFVLCMAVYVNKIFGLPAPKLIYIESFARVESLSFTGKLLRPLVDRFIVQWPQLLVDHGRGECYGWLV